MKEQYLWTEKYRPTKVADVILPPRIKVRFQQFVEQGNIPNCVLYGGPGVGKTTIAKAAMNELGCNHLLINGSLAGSIDTMRNDVSRFASTMSFNGRRKYIIFDEADGLTFQAQQGFRHLIEEFASNCGFILTCNYLERIMSAIGDSRMAQVSFAFEGQERSQLSAQFFKRVTEILDNENIKYDKKVIAEVVKMHFPDWRRVLMELQMNASSGTIDTGILKANASLNTLLPLLKDKKKYKEVRQWVADNAGSPQRVYDKFYDEETLAAFAPSYIPQLVVTTQQYQYESRTSANQEICMAAFLAIVMADAEWK